MMTKFPVFTEIKYFNIFSCLLVIHVLISLLLDCKLFGEEGTGYSKNAELNWTLYEARIAFLLHRQNTKEVEYLTDAEMCENDWYQYRALLVQI